MDEYINLGNGGKSRSIKGREERTKCIYMGICGNVTTVFWLEKETSFQKIRAEYMERGHCQRALEMATPPRWPISLLLTFCAKLRSLTCLPFHISIWVLGPVAWLAPGYFPYVVSPNAPKRH